jgi:hypothetical protein
LNQDTISSKYSIFIAGLPDTFCSSFYVKNDLFVNDSFELTDNDLISYGMKNVNEVSNFIHFIYLLIMTYYFDI